MKYVVSKFNDDGSIYPVYECEDEEEAMKTAYACNGVYEKVSPSLTDDQQVVLESLKHYYSKSNYYDIRAGKEPMQAVDRMLMEAESDTTRLSDVYYRLTEKQQFQVLAAFADWGLSTLDN